MRLLIEKGANVNWANADGDTLLMNAASVGHVEVARVLLAAGADIHAKNKYGTTALDDAKSTGHEEIAALIRQFDR
jgi:ankyrin repeat protein